MTSPALRGALLMLVMAACVAIDTIIVRLVSSEVHPFEIAFFRNLFSLPVLLPFFLASGLSGLRTPRAIIHVSRALLKLGSLICFFYSVALLPLATATAISFTTPLFVAFGAMLILGEGLNLRRIAALGLGFVGVLIVVRPGFVALDHGVVLALTGAVGLGIAGMLIKFLSVREEPGTVVGLNLVLTIPVALLLMLPVWHTPSLATLGLLIIQGLVGGVSQLCYSRAMSLADASLLLPIEFIRLPLVGFLAWAMFAETPSLWVLLGALLIFAGAYAAVQGGRRGEPL